jgi:hypothetical protein
VSVLIKQAVLDENGFPIWQYVKHSNSKFSDLPPKAQIRHFHAWVKSLTGCPRDSQRFSWFDDSESVTFRRCTDPKSPDFQKIVGKTFRFSFPMKKKLKNQHWRFRPRHPATIPLHDNFSRPVRRHDISKYGLYFQRSQEAPKLRLRPRAPAGRTSSGQESPGTKVPTPTKASGAGSLRGVGGLGPTDTCVDLFHPSNT